MIHLHTYNEGHGSSCKYCSYQKLKRAREYRQFVEHYQVIIDQNISSLVDELCTQIQDKLNNQGPVLVMHPATRNLKDIDPYLSELIKIIENVIDGRKLLIKNDSIGFAQKKNATLTYAEKSQKVEINKNVLDGIDINCINSVVIIDDTFDSGESYKITIEKLKEIGIETDKIIFASILKIESKKEPSLKI
jgi:hypothetical protein